MPMNCGVVGGFEVSPTALLQLWCVALDPAIDRAVVHLQPSFQHDFLQIAVAERIQISFLFLHAHMLVPDY